MDLAQGDKLRKNKPKVSKVLKEAGLSQALAQLRWASLTKSDRTKIGRVAKGKGWHEAQVPVVTKKGIKKKAPIHHKVAVKNSLKTTLRKPLQKTKEPVRKTPGSRETKHLPGEAQEGLEAFEETQSVSQEQPTAAPSDSVYSKQDTHDLYSVYIDRPLMKGMDTATIPPKYGDKCVYVQGINTDKPPGRVLTLTHPIETIKRGKWRYAPNTSIEIVVTVFRNEGYEVLKQETTATKMGESVPLYYLGKPHKQRVKTHQEPTYDIDKSAQELFNVMMMTDIEPEDTDSPTKSNDKTAKLKKTGFYIRLPDGTKELADDGSYPLNIYGIDLFAHPIRDSNKNVMEWRVSEVRTGVMLAKGNTDAVAEQNATDVIKRMGVDKIKEKLKGIE